MTDIRPATAQDLPSIGHVLSAAFADDPVMTWLTQHDERFARHAWRFFAADARGMMRKPGQVLVDSDAGGAALWCAPGHWKQTASHTLGLARPSLRLFGTRTPRALAALASLEKHHPGPPHWYLAVIGTAPAHQGRGIGSALIRAVTDRCDAEGVPAYLESSKESNVPYYERHGFKVTAEHRLAKDGPTLWLMWRDPR